MLHRSCLLTLCLATASCGWLRTPEQPTPSPTNVPQLVGRVASLHADDGFVLVQCLDDRKLAEGLLLTTRGDENRSASLIVTGERSGRYAAADLKGGEIEPGDAVFARQKPPENADPEPPETEKLPSGN